MNEDLTPEEVEALSKAMGNVPPSGGATGVTTGEASSAISTAQFLQLEELASATDLPANEMGRMYDVKVTVQVLLGSSKMPLEKILRLHPGSLVELDKLAGEPVDINANGELIAKGEIVVVDDYFGVKILEIAGSRKKINMV